MEYQYHKTESVTRCIICVTCFSLSPAEYIANAVSDLEATYSNVDDTEPLLEPLLRYTRRHWIDKSTIGLQKKSFGSSYRTHNVVEPSHASSKRCMQIPHPYLHIVLTHLGQERLTAWLTCHDCVMG